MGGHVDGIGSAIAFLFHDGDHDSPHGGRVSDWRARNATKQCASHHIGQAQATSPVTNQTTSEINNTVCNAPVQHQLTGEDEERNGQKREHIHTRCHHLYGGLKRQTLNNESCYTGQAYAKGNRQTQ